MKVFLYYCTSVEIIFDDEFKVRLTDNYITELKKKGE